MKNLIIKITLLLCITSCGHFPSASEGWRNSQGVKIPPALQPNAWKTKDISSMGSALAIKMRIKIILRVNSKNRLKLLFQ